MDASTAPAADRPRAAAGVLVRGARRPRRPPENLAESVLPIDRRTRLGRAVHEFRAGLVRHCGGRPSDVQSALIEVACQLKARLALMDAEFHCAGAMSAHTGRTYLAWSNALSRQLKLLGLKGVPERGPSLADYLSSRGRAAAESVDATPGAGVNTP